ncbi:His Kinase A (phospho-acceptor) domain-containing protein [Shimia aestuarii]|uniref:histidine kinase n=1 Tax=Shimia aestuarii TaxID=254406 RepID=A0A1I4R0Y7_9RHOB|nr:His Kinase A (phospho-acceptor) domain-containing protein [Shimia aestuarii]
MHTDYSKGHSNAHPVRRALKRLSSIVVHTGKPTVEKAHRLEKQVHDFASGGLALFWQRQGIYFGAALLCGFYYSLPVAGFCYLLCQLADIFDSAVSLKVVNRKDHSFRHTRRLLAALFASNTFSSLAVAIFTLLVAELEGPAEHFTSLFFLFAAGLFAAVNNHQLPQVLAVRLVIYGALFIYIPAHDIWNHGPSYGSKMWLHFATAIFVLYFVLECSMIFLRLYQRGLDQLEELRAERDKARDAYEVKSQFVSVVSHELRTPLTSINGALGLLRDTDLSGNPQSAARMIDIAHKNSQRLSKLINDLLDIQKMESSKMTYDFAPLELSDLLDEAVQSNSPYGDKFDVRLSITRTDPGLHVMADRERLMQVLDNLLSNAIKFSSPGSEVQISTSRDDDLAILEVRDFGIGIPENSRDAVFGKFTQVDGSDKRDHDGTGLGMSIAEQIVTDHNAHIDYDSTPGKGTRFYIEFPLIKGPSK